MIVEKLCDGITSFLKDRSIRVVVDGASSDAIPINDGVLHSFRARLEGKSKMTSRKRGVGCRARPYFFHKAELSEPLKATFLFYINNNEDCSEEFCVYTT